MDNPCAQVFVIILGVISVGLLATLQVYLGIYAYNNPDPKACWVVRDLHTSGTT